MIAGVWISRPSKSVDRGLLVVTRVRSLFFARSTLLIQAYQRIFFIVASDAPAVGDT